MFMKTRRQSRLHNIMYEDEIRANQRLEAAKASEALLPEFAESCAEDYTVDRDELIWSGEGPSEATMKEYLEETKKMNIPIDVALSILFDHGMNVSSSLKMIDENALVPVDLVSSTDKVIIKSMESILGKIEDNGTIGSKMFPGQKMTTIYNEAYKQNIEMLLAHQDQLSEATKVANKQLREMEPRRKSTKKGRKSKRSGGPFRDITTPDSPTVSSSSGISRGSSLEEGVYSVPSINLRRFVSPFEGTLPFAATVIQSVSAPIETDRIREELVSPSEGTVPFAAKVTQPESASVETDSIRTELVSPSEGTVPFAATVTQPESVSVETDSIREELVSPSEGTVPFAATVIQSVSAPVETDSIREELVSPSEGTVPFAATVTQPETAPVETDSIREELAKSRSDMNKFMATVKDKPVAETIKEASSEPKEPQTSPILVPPYQPNRDSTSFLATLNRDNSVVEPNKEGPSEATIKEYLEETKIRNIPIDVAHNILFDLNRDNSVVEPNEEAGSQNKEHSTSVTVETEHNRFNFKPISSVSLDDDEDLPSVPSINNSAPSINLRRLVSPSEGTVPFSATVIQSVSAPVETDSIREELEKSRSHMNKFMATLRDKPVAETIKEASSEPKEPQTSTILVPQCQQNRSNNSNPISAVSLSDDEDIIILESSSTSRSVVTKNKRRSTSPIQIVYERVRNIAKIPKAGKGMISNNNRSTATERNSTKRPLTNEEEYNLETDRIISRLAAVSEEKPICITID